MKRFFACLLLSLIFTLTVRSIAPTTLITIRFDGLQAIAMGNPAETVIGMLDAPHHTKLLTIRKDGDLITNTVIEGNIHFVGTKSISIAVDFDQVLHFDQLHNTKVPLADKFTSKIFLNTGQWYTYKLTREKYKFISTANGAMTQAAPIGYPACRIPIQSGEFLTITGVINQTIKNDGSNYEIEISNSPSPEMANVDHFFFYYDYVPIKLGKLQAVYVSPIAIPPPAMCPAVVFDSARLP